MDQRKLLTGVVLVLLALFTLPSWVGLAALVTGQFTPVPGSDGELIISGLGDIFFRLVFQNTPSPLWDLVKTALVAVMAALAALGLDNRVTLNGGVVTIGLGVAFVPLVILALYMMMPPASVFWENIEPPKVDELGFFRGWNTYVTGQAQVLAAQLALFLGIYRKDKA